MTKPKTAKLTDLNSAARGAPALVRAQNFTVERVQGSAGGMHSLEGAGEIMVIAHLAGVTLERAEERVTLSKRCIAILPPGATQLRFDVPGSVYVLSTTIQQSAALNAEDYAIADPRVAPVGAGFERRDPKGGIVVHEIDAIQAPSDNPRIKFLQSGGMSFNWVEYSGARDRTQLSPHKHADLEQMTLAVHGNYIHHIRSDWGPNADLWRDDAHIPAGPDTVITIPPDVIHTTEGVGDGHHLLIDVFAPPRRDFIARGWMFNAGDYCDLDLAGDGAT